MRYFLLLFFSFSLVGCSLLEKIPPTPTPTTPTTTLSPDMQEPLKETISGNHEEYYPIFGTGLGTKVIKAVHKTGQQTKISFINSRAKSMEVNITFPEKNGNLRFSQIIMPDGTMDGPFGQHVGYNLKQFGGYTLIFNENQMAGDPWSGNADISITLHESTYEDDVILLP